MTITTVKIRDETKSSLDELKSERESYDDIIARLVSAVKRKSLMRELVAGYKSVGKKELDTLKEWESASADAE